MYAAGRRKGAIGQTLDDEEKYLMEISDRDARDGETYVNLTYYPKLYLEKWTVVIMQIQLDRVKLDLAVKQPLPSGLS
jgi:hypothetical protein